MSRKSREPQLHTTAVAANKWQWERKPDGTVPRPLSLPPRGVEWLSPVVQIQRRCGEAVSHCGLETVGCSRLRLHRRHPMRQRSVQKREQ